MKKNRAIFVVTLMSLLLSIRERPAAFVSCAFFDSVFITCTSGHGTITRDALIRLSPTPSPAAVDRIAEADENVDSSETAFRLPVMALRQGEPSPYLVPTPQYAPRHHFDRPLGVTSADAFAQGEIYVQQERTTSQRLLGSGCRNIGQGLDALGRALHAIQDVYSHSNYVDSGAGLPGLGSAAKDQVDALLIDGHGSPPKGIQLTLYDRKPRERVQPDGTILAPDFEDPIPGGYSHKSYAKDSPDKNSIGKLAYDAAYAAAVAETKRFMEAVIKAIGKDPWNNVVRYQTPSDPCQQPQSQTQQPPPKPPADAGLNTASPRCPHLPQLDSLLLAVNECKQTNLGAKTTRVKSCMDWWLGYPTCTVPEPCTPLVDRYYSFLTGSMGMANRKSVIGGTMRAEAINGQLRNSCRNPAAR